MRAWAAALAAISLLAGCGYVGEPLPPALNIPVAVTDLRAAEYGDAIVLEFTRPALTTEGLPLKTPQAVELFVGPPESSAEAWAAGARRYPLAPGQQQIPARDWIGKDVLLGVRTLGPKGKASAWSNLVPLQVIEPLAPPAGFRAENTERGVTLKWQSAASKFRVFRATEDSPPQALASVEASEFVDETTVYGTRYLYRVQALASETQQSEVTNPVEITPEDRFPPAVPKGVTAIAGSESIELAWERNTEEDFQGYHIYRSVEAGPFERVAASIDSPVFSDTRVEAGKRYRYSVSSVDMKGNESARSEIVEVLYGQ